MCAAFGQVELAPCRLTSLWHARGVSAARVTLIGGGWTDSALPAVYGPFLAAAGEDPTVACVVIDEGDGPEQFARWQAALTAVAPCRPVPVLVPLGATLDTEALADAGALLVCGGLTPAYADALAPVADPVRAWLAAGRPYAGFSAGAAVAAAEALVGGYRVDGRAVCPPDAGEDLEEVTVTRGLGLVDVTVDVHAATWGTLARAVAAVASGRASEVHAIDEDTALTVDADGRRQVVGLGAVHVVSADGDGVAVRSVAAGRPLS